MSISIILDGILDVKLGPFRNTIQHKLAIARALVIEPDILLLDEPLNALDPNTRTALREELKRVHEVTRATTIHVTHDQTEALLLADKIAVIIDGEIAQIGTPLEVFNKPTSLSVAYFLGIENILTGEVTNHLKGITHIKVNDYYILVDSEIKSGEVYVFIRQGDITLSETPLEKNMRNVLESTIKKVVNVGKVYQVEADNGIKSIAAKQSIEEMKLETGKKYI